MGHEIITHSCGHESRVQLYGPLKDRERKAAWMAKDCCPECAAKARLERAAEVAAADAAAGLPTLTGSDKQIAWALDIRTAIMADLNERLAKVDAAPVKPGLEWQKEATMPLLREGISKVLSETSASVWIDRRDSAAILWTDLAKAAVAQAKLQAPQS